MSLETKIFENFVSCYLFTTHSFKLFCCHLCPWGYQDEMSSVPSLKKLIEHWRDQHIRMGNNVKRAIIRHRWGKKEEGGLRRLGSGFSYPGWWEEWHHEQGALCKYWSADGGLCFIGLFLQRVSRAAHLSNLWFQSGQLDQGVIKVWIFVPNGFFTILKFPFPICNSWEARRGV